MAKKKTNKKSKKQSWAAEHKVGLGVGLTATAVAAAGAYFLYGSEHAKDNRKRVKSWMLKAKAEVLESLEQAQEMTEEEYDKLIDSVSSAYSRLKDASKADIATFKREMKQHWKGIEKAANPAKKAAKKTTKKATKKVAKKTTKKTAKKTTKKK